MNKIFKSENGFTPVEVLLIILILAVMGSIGYTVYHNDTSKMKTSTVTAGSSKSTTTAPKSASENTTNNQIYDEVVAQFMLTKSTLEYFRIFSDDKVQYSTGAGTTYAYKLSGTWHIAVAGEQGAQNCNQFGTVPANFRPECVSSSGNLAYAIKDADGSSGSSNYPEADAVSVIVQ
jgi:Tfp pilus assembly protein PilE